MSSTVFVCSISNDTSIVSSDRTDTPSGNFNAASTVPDFFISSKLISSVEIELIPSSTSLVANTSTSSKSASDDMSEYPSGNSPDVVISIGTVLLGLSTSTDTTTFSGSIPTRNSFPWLSYTLTGTSRLFTGSVIPPTSMNTFTMAICSTTLLELVIVTVSGL